MSSENYEANRYRHELELELAIISHAHYLRVSHHRRSGCKTKSVHLRPAYLILPNYRYRQLRRTEFHSATFDHKSHTHSTQILQNCSNKGVSTCDFHEKASEEKSGKKFPAILLVGDPHTRNCRIRGSA